MQREFHTYRLPNGIRGIHRRVKGNVAHCALVVNAGSRDERPGEYGLAHFAEHAFFKGTQRRRAWQVNCRLENLGGELNAFTTKEDTTIHATTLRGDFARAAELLADVAFRSTFPDRELEREKEVIYDEINTYKDSPADLIYDTFEDMLFEGSELGHNILGRKAALARYNGDSIRAFTSRTYSLRLNITSNTLHHFIKGFRKTFHFISGLKNRNLNRQISICHLLSTAGKHFERICQTSRQHDYHNCITNNNKEKHYRSNCLHITEESL